MNRCENGFALIVPIGPGTRELRRFHDLLESIFTLESAPRLCVVIESETRARHLVPERFRAHGCGFVTIPPQFEGQGEALMGRLSAHILLALRTVHDAGCFEFILRMDTDALVIRPFREAIQCRLALHPDAGMLGTLGSTCRREVWYFGIEKTCVSDVVQALEAGQGSEPARTRISEHYRRAVANGYAGKEYCQGGAYALSHEMLGRMSVAGCLDHPDDWVPLAVPEDVMIGVYARAVGLRSLDCSAPGEPFGNHHRGLAYSPRRLVTRGHALIHSVKGDRRYSETEIRRYFQLRRREARQTPALKTAAD